MVGGSPGQHGWFLQNKPTLIDEAGEGDAGDDNEQRLGSFDTFVVHTTQKSGTVAPFHAFITH